MNKDLACNQHFLPLWVHVVNPSYLVFFFSPLREMDIKVDYLCSIEFKMQ